MKNLTKLDKDFTVRLKGLSTKFRELDICPKHTMRTGSSSYYMYTKVSMDRRWSCKSSSILILPAPTQTFTFLQAILWWLKRRFAKTKIAKVYSNNWYTYGSHHVFIAIRSNSTVEKSQILDPEIQKPIFNFVITTLRSAIKSSPERSPRRGETEGKIAFGKQIWKHV
jgi:hypothetical protein